MLHLCILPGDGKENARRAIDSFGCLVSSVIVCPTREIKIDTKSLYTGYLYWDEYLEPKLREALAVFLLHDYWEFLVLYRKIMENQEMKGARISPRIFKNTVQLNGLLPATPSYVSERVLDGWILGD
jgi:hypothetical protein